MAQTYIILLEEFPRWHREIYADYLQMNKKDMFDVEMPHHAS